MKLKEVSILLAIIFIGITLRTYNLGKRDFWYDEAWKLSTSKDLKTVYLDNRPFFNFLLHFYLKIIPKNKFLIRFLPAFFGMLSLPFFFLLCRQVMPLHSSLFGTFLLSISPLHIWYSQELRGYSLSFLLAILDVYFFLRAVKTNKTKYFIFFTFFSILSSYTSYILLFLLIPEIVFLYLYYPKSSKKFLFSILITSIFFYFRYYSFIYQFVFFTESFWTKPPTLKDLLIVLENFNIGYNSTPLLYHLSFFLSIPLLILPIKLKEKEKRNFLIIFFLLPFVFSYLISFVFPIFITRAIFPLSPFYILFISSGTSLIKKKNLFLIYSLLWIPLITFSLLNHYSNLMPSSFPYHVGTYPKMPYKDVIKLIKKNYKKDDVIGHTNPGTVAPFIYYLGKDFKQLYFIIPKYQDKYWRRNILKWKVPKELNIPVIPPINLSLKKNLPYKRVWLISSDWARDWNIDTHSKKVIEFMKKRYKIVYEKWVDGILVILFTHR